MTLLGLPASAIPPLLLGVSLLAAIVMFLLPANASRARIVVNLGAAILKAGVVLALVPLILSDAAYPGWSIEIFPGVELGLRIDSLSLIYAGLSSVLWLVTTVYAIAYMRGKPEQRRFFGFFALCVTSTVGLGFSSNLVTFLLFYEMLTLVTYPLVAHTGTTAALRSGRLYLAHSLSGGLAVLLGTVWLTSLVGPVSFNAGGAEAVAELAASDPRTATAILLLLLVGLGVKAAIFPLHGWLPRAMVAPAPVSALLHAVAVVKAGAFGIVRVVDDLFGVRVAESLGGTDVLLAAAAFTILYGSLRALAQDDLKARLAYSTVSQVSYIALGIALVSVTATTAGVAHLVHQGITKITLFFCAGLYAEVLGEKSIAGLAGAGRRMPWTSAAFTVGALGMIGVPPLAGFVTKWQLGAGALEAGHPEILAVLVASALLNAAYFLPIVYSLWFREPPAGAFTAETWRGIRPRPEAPPAFLLPAVVTAALAILAGVFAGWEYSPLGLAEYVAERTFG